MLTSWLANKQRVLSGVDNQDQTSYILSASNELRLIDTVQACAGIFLVICSMMVHAVQNQNESSNYKERVYNFLFSGDSWLCLLRSNSVFAERNLSMVLFMIGHLERGPLYFLSQNGTNHPYERRQPKLQRRQSLAHDDSRLSLMKEAKKQVQAKRTEER